MFRAILSAVLIINMVACPLRCSGFCLGENVAETCIDDAGSCSSNCCNASRKHEATRPTESCCASSTCESKQAAAKNELPEPCDPEPCDPEPCDPTCPCGDCGCECCFCDGAIVSQRDILGELFNTDLCTVDLVVVVPVETARCTDSLLQIDGFACTGKQLRIMQLSLLN